jgi:hypothetical protein
MLVEGVSKKLECMLLLFFFFIEDFSGLKMVHQPPNECDQDRCRRRDLLTKVELEHAMRQT